MTSVGVNIFGRLAEAAESYVGQSHRRMRDRYLTAKAGRVATAWGAYFRKQGAWWIAKHMPEMRHLFEAARPLPPSMRDASEGLGEFGEESAIVLTLIEMGEALAAAGEFFSRKLGVKSAFDLKNPRAVAYMRQRGAELVRGIDETSKARLRTLLSEATDEGWSYGKLASAIRRLFADFARYRAHMIARTELGNAYTEGTAIVGRLLTDKGVEVEKRWIAVQTEPNEECHVNASQGWIPMGEPFESGDDQPLAHPNCRCALVVRRKPS